MARRKGSGIEAVASLPWQAGIVLGLVGYIAIQYGPRWLLGSSTDPFLAALAKAGAYDAYRPIAFVVLALCWFGALAAYLGRRHRRRLLDTRTDLQSLAANGWRQFELLVGEAFRRHGYSVEETGLGGPDGGIDLILRKDNRHTLVQCKQWKRRQIGVNTVREMYGLLAHHQAHAVKIVGVGSYTRDAQQFAQGKPIELISGEDLLRMIRAVQQTPRPTSSSMQSSTLPQSTPTVASAARPPEPATTLDDRAIAMQAASPSACPRCAQPMVRRHNRKTGESFLGCSAFPKCRATL